MSDLMRIAAVASAALEWRKARQAVEDFRPWRTPADAVDQKRYDNLTADLKSAEECLQLAVDDLERE